LDPIRIHLDENCDVGLASELRAYGMDVTTTYDMGLPGSSDRRQLEFAHAERRVVISHDFDMVKLHRAGVVHQSIIHGKMNRRSVAEMGEEILKVAELHGPKGLVGLLVKLSEI